MAKFSKFDFANNQVFYIRSVAASTTTERIKQTQWACSTFSNASLRKIALRSTCKPVSGRPANLTTCATKPRISVSSRPRRTDRPKRFFWGTMSEVANLRRRPRTCKNKKLIAIKIDLLIAAINFAPEFFQYGAQIAIKKEVLCLHRRDEVLNSQDSHHALQVIRQDVQTHLGFDLRQRLR